MDNSVTDYNNSTIHISQFANTSKKTKTNQAKDNRGLQAATTHVQQHKYKYLILQIKAHMKYIAFSLSFQA